MAEEPAGDERTPEGASGSGEVSHARRLCPRAAAEEDLKDAVDVEPSKLAHQFFAEVKNKAPPPAVKREKISARDKQSLLAAFNKPSDNGGGRVARSNLST